jgi:hypothetical protein
MDTIFQNRVGEWDAVVGWKMDEFINSAQLFSGRDFLDSKRRTGPVAALRHIS